MSTPPKPGQERPAGQIPIKVSDDMLAGVYANLLLVTHTREEFLLDFASVMPGGGRLNARVVTSPGHLKRIVRALEENLVKYESAYGRVPEAEEMTKPTVSLVSGEKSPAREGGEPRPWTFGQKEERPGGAPPKPGAERPGGHIQLKVGDELLGGVYANLLLVSHTREEFVLDFVSVFPGGGRLNARVITSPGHLKRTARALEDNLVKYESMFGKVVESEEPPKPIIALGGGEKLH